MGSISEKFESFPNVPMGPEDPMFDLKIRLVADKAPDKVDLGAGVYRDEQGRYYELPTVKKAKAILAAEPANHDYALTAGDPNFLKAAAQVIFGKDSEALQSKKIASAQTIAGTGANRIGAVFAHRFFAAGAPTTVYIGSPAWGNYEPLFQYAGIPIKLYRYYDREQKKVDFTTVIETVRTAPRGSIFVLQGCCHNPTGRDFSKEEWVALADALEQGNHLPFFDVAYQGFGHDLDEDAWAVREFERRGFEFIVAQSFSKNLGLYGERVGVVHVVLRDSQATANVADQLRSFIRWDWSSPPRYGAKLASIVLDQFWDEWVSDLKSMRERLQRNRQTLHRFLTEDLKTPGYWDNILQENGLFSFLALTEAQVERIILDSHVHFPKTGRINVAGLSEANLEKVARAIDSAVRGS